MTAFVDSRERLRPEPLVVKIGGSLLSGGRLAGIASTLARSRRGIVIVPGGGGFADEVRKAQTRHEVSDRTAHAMALLAMHQTGLLIEDLQSRFVAVETIAEIRKSLRANVIPVWLPTRMCATDSAIPENWSITSDGLAARLAERLGFQAVVLVKSRRVGPGAAAAELAAEGVVDPEFPNIVSRADISFRIIGPGEERELAEICCATPPVTGKARRPGQREVRPRRISRRAPPATPSPPRQ